mgnify:CR=1 FL=1|jgi:hypothetical protein
MFPIPLSVTLFTIIYGFQPHMKNIRRNPNAGTPAEDKGGFTTPLSPGHSLKLLNEYMRTDLLLQLIHGTIHEQKDKKPAESPLKHIAYSLDYTLSVLKGSPNINGLSANPRHLNRGFRFEAKEDFKHDLKLMSFHLKAHQKTLNECI